MSTPTPPTLPQGWRETSRSTPNKRRYFSPALNATLYFTPRSSSAYLRHFGDTPEACWVEDLGTVANAEQAMQILNDQRLTFQTAESDESAE